MKNLENKNGAVKLKKINQRIFLTAIVGFFTMSVLMLFGYFGVPKVACERTSVADLNNYYGSEHIVTTEIFWSEKHNTCFVITRRPFVDPTSGWSIRYFNDRDIDSYFIEAEYFRLGTYPEDFVP